jgi:hypothetical protein
LAGGVVGACSWAVDAVSDDRTWTIRACDRHGPIAVEPDLSCPICGEATTELRVVTEARLRSVEGDLEEARVVTATYRGSSISREGQVQRLTGELQALRDRVRGLEKQLRYAADLCPNAREYILANLAALSVGEEGGDIG